MIDYDPDRRAQPQSDGELAWLQKELDEAHKTIRSLLRQLSKEQARHAETARAYNLTVANLVEATRQNALLEHERDSWKARAEGQGAPFTLGDLTLTPEEVSAIRKAMARLHHPDTGGDVERMKQWNAALDPLED
jgi:post-segregation antitoxin (ccd killing protein)